MIPEDAWRASKSPLEFTAKKFLGSQGMARERKVDSPLPLILFGNLVYRRSVEYQESDKRRIQFQKGEQQLTGLVFAKKTREARNQRKAKTVVEESRSFWPWEKVPFGLAAAEYRRRTFRLTDGRSKLEFDERLQLTLQDFGNKAKTQLPKHRWNGIRGQRGYKPPTLGATTVR